AAVVLDEGIATAIETVRADVGVDLVAQRTPALDRPLVPEMLAGPDAPVEGHPAHQPRVRERARRPANLPDAVVGFAPGLLEGDEQRTLQSPGLVERTELGFSRRAQRVHQFAVDVELAL